MEVYNIMFSKETIDHVVNVGYGDTKIQVIKNN